MINLVRSNIRNLEPYSSARSEFKGKANIFLDANENPFDNKYNRYPDPLQKEVKEKIATLKGVKQEQIFLGNGSDEAIDLLIRIFCEPAQDSIMILPPTYGMYQVSANISNVAIQEVPLTADYQLDVNAILNQVIPATKLLFICSPNNPTGNSMNQAAIRKILDNFEGIVVVDEAYIDFSEQTSLLNWIEQYPNLVVLQTFSKAWGLAGIRLGMAFSNSTIIDLFNKVKPPYNVNILTQHAALKALKQVEQTEQYIQTILIERKKLIAELVKLPFIQKIHPSDSNFILVKVKEADRLYQHLVDQGIIIRNRSKLALCEDCLRITIGKPKENQTLIQMLKSISLNTKYS
ncbi:MAG: histidinol-phosphate transaminase [Aureispira sp.]|nr:histidinol-phosphate transaminase [Aureispira sp.]